MKTTIIKLNDALAGVVILMLKFYSGSCSKPVNIATAIVNVYIFFYQENSAILSLCPIFRGCFSAY